MSEYDDDGGFVLYDEKSTDPGPSVLIATIILCTLLLAILPVLLSVAKRWNTRRRRDLASTDSEEVPDAAGLTTLKKVRMTIEPRRPIFFDMYLTLFTEPGS